MDPLILGQDGDDKRVWNRALIIGLLAGQRLLDRLVV
jgi:hypothetical protein